MKSVIVIFLLSLLIIPIASAVEIEVKNSFSQEETFIAKVSGNFFDPVVPENVFFYRGHVRTSVEKSVKKIDGDYYITGQLSNKPEGNYSLSIENTRYYEINELKDDDVVRDFTITNETASFSINPAAVSTKNDFSISITNFLNDEITVEARITNKSETNKDDTGFFASLFESQNEPNSDNSISIKSGETKNMNFDISDFSSGLQFVELSYEDFYYNVPVEKTSETDEKEEQSNFEFEPSLLNVTAISGSNTTRIVYLENTGGSDIENITFYVSEFLEPYVTLSNYTSSGVDKNSSEKISVLFSSEKKVYAEGQITAESEDLITHIAVYFNSVGEGTSGKNGSTVSETCENIGGEICPEDQQCDGEIRYATDGVCCVGQCIEKRQGSTGVYIGWGIVIIVIGFLLWFYLRRYKRVDKKDIDLFKFVRKRK